MDQATAIKRLTEWDSRGRYLFTARDLAHVFPEDSLKTLKEALARLVRAGLLQRVCRGIYLFPLARTRDHFTVERIAKALRRGEYNYVSNESALAEYGALSQAPVDRLTVMTTGRRGVYQTPFGVIELTHTRRGIVDILAGSRDVGRPLRMATPETAWRDLKRVGRNTHLVDERALADG